MMKMLRFVFYTELVLQLRRSQDWLHPIGFFIVIISLFPLIFTPDPAFLSKYIPSCIWIAALFASLLSIDTIFYSDQEDGHLEQLLLCTAPLPLLLITKLGAKWMVSELPLVLLAPVLGCLFHLTWTSVSALCLSLLLGTPILTLLGSLGVALTLGLRQQGALLGLLILPLSSPVLVFGVSIIQQAQAHLPIASPVAMLAALCILSLSLLPLAIAATLRVGFDDSNHIN